jgi:hypothetical protein
MLLLFAAITMSSTATGDAAAATVDEACVRIVDDDEEG